MIESTHPPDAQEPTCSQCGKPLARIKKISDRNEGSDTPVRLPGKSLGLMPSDG
jgi:hypothetical protein